MWGKGVLAPIFRETSPRWFHSAKLANVLFTTLAVNIARVCVYSEPRRQARGRSEL